MIRTPPYGDPHGPPPLPVPLVARVRVHHPELAPGLLAGVHQHHVAGVPRHVFGVPRRVLGAQGAEPRHHLLLHLG
eukprot:417770-Prorocentrum_minimum.AAC.1